MAREVLRRRGGGEGGGEFGGEQRGTAVWQPWLAPPRPLPAASRRGGGLGRGGQGLTHTLFMLLPSLEGTSTQQRSAGGPAAPLSDALTPWVTT